MAKPEQLPPQCRSESSPIASLCLWRFGINTLVILDLYLLVDQCGPPVMATPPAYGIGRLDDNVARRGAAMAQIEASHRSIGETSQLYWSTLNN